MDTKRKLALGLSLAVILAMVITTLALADVIDGDTVASGIPTANLGTVSPGAILTPQVTFQLDCTGNKHVDNGQTVNLTFSLAGSTVPAGGSLSATNASIGPIPSAWPDDTTGSPNCGSAAPLNDNGNSIATITAPTAPGTYTYVVHYPNSLSPAGDNDPSSITAAATDVTFILTVAGNTAPVLDPIGNKTVDEETTLNFTATASDSDTPAQTLTFSLVGAPPGASITNSGAFSWTPTEAQGPGDYTFTVKVCDDGTPSLCDDEMIAVHVNEVNKAPVLGAIGTQSVDEGTLLSFAATATDADIPANTLTFSLVGAPAGASINGSTGAFSWTPVDNGTFTFTVKVCDNGSPVLCDEEAITVTVNNVAPTVSALTIGGGTGTACMVGNVVTLDFSFSDPGVNDANWHVDINWGDGSSHTIYDTATQGAQAQQSHTYGVGSFTISVSVTDKDGGTGSNSSSAGAVSHLYDMTGILAPFNPDGSSVWKYGSTLPVKVRITDCSGAPVPGLAPNVGTLLSNSNDPSINLDETPSTSAADTTGIMRYDPTAGQYIYNFGSKYLPDPNATYYMTVRGTDSSGNIVTSPGMVQVKFGLKAK